MERKINLESIILEAYGCKDVSDFKKSFDVSIQMVKEICIEACRQTLKLAAENVKRKISKTLSKPVKCVTDNITFNSIKEAVMYSGVPKTTFHRKFHKGELINNKKYESI